MTPTAAGAAEEVPASQRSSAKGGGRGGSTGSSRPRAETAGADKPKDKKYKRGDKSAEDDEMAAGAAEASSQQERQQNKKESLSNVKTAKILKAIVKALLRTMQDTRDVTSCCIDVLIGPSEATIFQDMASQTSEYSKLDKAAKEASGSPHLLAFCGLLTAIIAKGPSVGQANYEAVVTYNEQVKHFTPLQLNEHVRLCKQARCYKSETKKLYLELGRCPAREQILVAIIQMGFVKKGGRAPPSHLERDLIEWLQQL